MPPIPVTQTAPAALLSRQSSSSAETSPASAPSRPPRSTGPPALSRAAAALIEELRRDDRVLSIHEAAEATGLSIFTLKRLGKRGDIKILKLSARRLGIRLSELQRYLDSRATFGGEAA
jgi:hypothetical protein